MSLSVVIGALAASSASRPALTATRAVATSAAIGSFLQGYHTGVVGGALLHLVPELKLAAKPALIGLIVTAATIGSFVGTASAAPLADVFGRRGSLQLASMLFVASSVLLAWSPSIRVLVAARLLTGLAIGNAGAAVPIYIAEVSDPKNRGALATLPQLFISSGIFLSYVVCLALSLTFKRSPWRSMLGLSFVPSILFAICMVSIPESPRWLLARNRKQEAKKALATLRGVPAQTDLVSAEFAALELAVQKKKGTDTKIQSSNAMVSLFSTPHLRRTLAVVVILQTLQQFSGINAIVYYTPQTLKEAGVPSLFASIGFDAAAASLAATALAYLPRIPTMFATMNLMDSYGRRSLLMAFVPIMGASLLALACAGANTPILAVAATCVYGCAFSLSLGPIPNILTSEMFPMHARAAAMSVSLGVQFACNTLVGFFFPLLRAKIGTSAVLVVFATVCFIGSFFTWRFVPETRGLSIDE